MFVKSSLTALILCSGLFFQAQALTSPQTRGGRSGGSPRTSTKKATRPLPRTSTKRATRPLPPPPAESDADAGRPHDGAADSPELKCGSVEAEALKNNVVKVTAEFKTSSGVNTETGAGVIIGSSDDEVMVLTAKHVAVPPSVIESQGVQIRVRFFNMGYGDDFPASARRVSQELDFAVIAVKRLGENRPSVKDFKMLRVRRPSLKEGSMVFVIGHPLTLDWQCVANSVKKLSYNENFETLLFNSANEEGVSGGPVLDENGRLAGLAFENSPDGGRAIKIDAIMQVLEDWRMPAHLLQRPKAPPDPVGDDPSTRKWHAAILKNYVEQLNILKELRAEADALQAWRGDASQLKVQYESWVERCGTTLNRIWQIQKSQFVEPPPDHRSMFEAVTRLPDERQNRERLRKSIIKNLVCGSLLLKHILATPEEKVQPKCSNDAPSDFKQSRRKIALTKGKQSTPPLYGGGRKGNRI